MSTRIAAKITLTGVSFSYDYTGKGGASTLTIPDGSYYILDDGTAADLITTLTGLLDGVSAGGVDVGLSADGVVTITCGDTAGTITWDADSTTLRDILRLSGSTTTIAPSVTGSRTCKYLAIAPGAMVDRRSIDVRASVTDADDGTLSVLTLTPEISDYAVQFLLIGPHRSASWVSYHAWRDLWRDALSKGTLCRWYPDTTITAAYADVSAPKGYHVVRMVAPRTWTDTQFFERMSDRYVLDLVLREQTS